MLPPVPIFETKIDTTYTIIIKKEEPKRPIEYVIKQNDSLAKIAKNQNTTIDRLWDKNPVLTNPDVIKPGDKLTVPLPDEQLVDRPLPAIIEPVAPALDVPRQVSNSKPAPSIRRGLSGGNTYTRGQCTHYAKQKRPDLPNNLGNANTWYSRAKAQGIPTGTTPRVGAIGMAVKGYMHVVYIERVNANGTVYLSEQNYKGAFIVSTRTAPASDFVYIY